MELTDIAETAIDWATVSVQELPGESGTARVRSWQGGGLQLRVIDYSAGYLADHWCRKGHLLQVLAGDLTIEHEDGSAPLSLLAGRAWVAPDAARPAHRVRSLSGARVFVVD